MRRHGRQCLGDGERGMQRGGQEVCLGCTRGELAKMQGGMRLDWAWPGRRGPPWMPEVQRGQGRELEVTPVQPGQGLAGEPPAHISPAWGERSLIGGSSPGGSAVASRYWL